MYFFECKETNCDCSFEGRRLLLDLLWRRCDLWRDDLWCKKCNHKYDRHSKESVEERKMRLENERLEKEKLEQERLENERLENERLKRERLEQERLEQKRLKKERKELLEKENKQLLLKIENFQKLEQERIKQERLEQEIIKREMLEILEREKQLLLKIEEFQRIGEQNKEMTEKLKKKINFISAKLEKTVEPSVKEEEKQSFSFVEEIKPFLFCSLCKKLFDNPQICPECDLSCCVGCCKSNSFCPFECKNSKMESNSIYQKRISNLQVNCLSCQKTMKKIDFEKHSDCKTSCRWKDIVGCTFQDAKGITALHEVDCEKYKKYLVIQKQNFLLALPSYIQELNNIIDKK